MKPKNKFKVVFLGVAGSNNAFSLSLYNLKAFVLSDPDIRSKCKIKVIQHPLIHYMNHEKKLGELSKEIIKENPDLLGLSSYLWNNISVSKQTFLKYKFNTNSFSEK